VNLLQNALSKLGANLLQNTVPKNVGLQTVPKLLLRNVVFQKIVSSNARF
jgi:hypothetical protein